MSKGLGGALGDWENITFHAPLSRRGVARTFSVDAKIRGGSGDSVWRKDRIFYAQGMTTQRSHGLTCWACGERVLARLEVLSSLEDVVESDVVKSSKDVATRTAEAAKNVSNYGVHRVC